MSYKSVAEIFDDIEQTRERLSLSVSELNAVQQGFRPSPETWSVADIVEHLSIVEGRVVRLLGKLLDKAGSNGLANSSEATFAPVSIAEQVELTRTRKLDAPEQIRPTGASLSDSLSNLRRSRAALLALRPRVERTDCTEISFPHPVWGTLNLYQWIAFVGAHESRHLAQIDALKETMNAQG